MNTTFEARENLERDFVSCALAACCAKSADPLALAAICPPDFLVSTVPQAIYRALVELAQEGKPVLVDAVWSHIHAGQHDMACKKPWSKAVCAKHVADYAISLHSPEYLDHYARQMRGEALKRNAEGKLAGLMRECQLFGNDPAEIASSLAAIAQEMEGGAIEEHDLSGLMARLVEQVESGAGSEPLPTPWPGLNAVLKGGIAPGELAILAGRPGMGKTAFAGCFAIETAASGIPTLFVSREVKDLTLAARLVSRSGRIDGRYFRQGMQDATSIAPKIRKHAEALARHPMRIVEKSVAPMTPLEVRRLAKTTRDIGLIVVDYLQLLNPNTKSLSREREVAEMSRQMKQLALDCDCPVLLLSQLNRSVEESSREPRLSDLRESGAIEQDADIVIFLHARQSELGQSRMPVKAIVAKGRSSGTGAASLIFDKPFSDFTEDFGGSAWARGERQDAGDNGL